MKENLPWTKIQFTIDRFSFCSLVKKMKWVRLIAFLEASVTNTARERERKKMWHRLIFFKKYFKKKNENVGFQHRVFDGIRVVVQWKCLPMDNVLTKKYIYTRACIWSASIFFLSFSLIDQWQKRFKVIGLFFLLYFPFNISNSGENLWHSSTERSSFAVSVQRSWSKQENIFVYHRVHREK